MRAERGTRNKEKGEKSVREAKGVQEQMECQKADWEEIPGAGTPLSVRYSTSWNWLPNTHLLQFLSRARDE